MACKENCERTCKSWPRCNGCGAYDDSPSRGALRWGRMMRDAFDAGLYSQLYLLSHHSPIRPLRSKHPDGLRAHVTIIDEFASTKNLNKKVKESMRKIPEIKNVIFNEPATIVFWSDDTKTVVKCHNEKFDPEKGLAMAIAKKALGNEHDYYGKNFEKWVGGEIKKEEPKPAKRMTFREEVAIKEPNRIGNACYGDVKGCPKDRPDGVLSKECNLRNCWTKVQKDACCRKCWDREIPEEKKPVEDSVLRKGDKVVKVKGPYDSVDNHKLGTIVEVHDASARPSDSVITKGLVNWGVIETQITYRDSLRKLAKDQTLRPGDKAVVVKGPSYNCRYTPGQTIVITHVKGDGDIIAKVHVDDKYYQILKASEVVKIVE